MQQATNPPISGDVAINHKPLNRIELSQLSQDLFDLIFSGLTLCHP